MVRVRLAMRASAIVMTLAAMATACGSPEGPARVSVPISTAFFDGRPHRLGPTEALEHIRSVTGSRFVGVEFERLRAALIFSTAGDKALLHRAGHEPGR